LVDVSRGSRHARARFTESQICEIRARVGDIRAGGRSPHGAMKALAEEYGVTPQALDHVARGDCWRHVP
jgi:hypothetical protein